MEWTQKKRSYHQQVFYRKRAQKRHENNLSNKAGLL